MDEARIEQIISQYTYGLGNIANPEVQITYLSSKGIIRIGPELHDRSDRRNDGDCYDLAANARRRLKQELPRAHLMYAIGTESRFFRNSRCPHQFILAAEHNLLKERRRLEGEEACQVLKEDPLLIDPSLGVVRRFSASGYGVSMIIRPTGREKPPRFTAIKPGYALPLGIHACETVWLGHPKARPGELGVAFRDAQDKVTAYDLTQLDQIAARLKEERLLNIVTAAAKKYRRL